MIAYKTVLEERDGIDIDNNPHPAIIKHLLVVRHQLADKLMQVFDVCALQKDLPAIPAGDFGQ